MPPSITYIILSFSAKYLRFPLPNGSAAGVSTFRPRCRSLFLLTRLAQGIGNLAGVGPGQSKRYVEGLSKGSERRDERLNENRFKREVTW